MSTILLTPEHMACDHTITYNVHPHHTVVDPDYKKIFVPEHKQFALGVTGNFNPDHIDSIDCYTLIRDFLKEALTDPGNEEKIYTPKDPNALKKYLLFFDPQARVFVVTKEDRFVFFKSPSTEKLRIGRLGDYVGTGSGGDYGMGMLLGGADIHTLWEDLHKLDDTTSVAHTIFPLKELSDFSFADQEVA